MAVQSVDRALSLLEAVADEPCGLADIAKRVDLALSTTARLLKTLEGRQAVIRDGNGRYSIGSFVTGLSDGAQLTANIQDAAHDQLAWLADVVDEAACLSIPLGTEMLTLTQVDVPRPVQAQDWTGHRWSITAGGSGAVLMATWPESRMAPLLASVSPKECRSIRAAITKAAESGVCWSRGSYVADLSSVAAAVVDRDGRGVACVIAYGPSYRFPAKNQMRRIEQAVTEAARVVSEKLEA
ncbi:MAG: helix-turn-helix domain-containing protein [Actinobacteria bacterium]|nr:helix-turn-helix domain-containing protein [Actinomycetota bacterium]